MLEFWSSRGSLVNERLKEAAKGGALFVFCNRRHTRIKILYWEETGLWVLTKGNGFLKHLGLSYPTLAEVDRMYIDDLPTADGGSVSYDHLFEKALRNVPATWLELSAALDAGNKELFAFKNGNLGYRNC